MKELIRFVRKEKHKELLEVFLILDEIAKNNDILSFSYTQDYLTIQIGLNDYYRIKMIKEVI